MPKVVRQLEYFGSEGHLQTWLELSLADGISPMFGPERRLVVTTLHSDVDSTKFGIGRPFDHRWEGGEKEWREEVDAVREALKYYLGRCPNEDNRPAMERALARLEEAK